MAVSLGPGGLLLDNDTIDDYEVGNYTPVLSTTSGGNVTLTSGTFYGRYIKTGEIVIAFLQMHNITYTGANGEYRITLPFTANTDNINGHGCAGFFGPTHVTSYPNGGNYASYAPRTINGVASLRIWYNISGSGDATWNSSNSTLGRYMSMTIIYTTNS